MQLYRKFSAGLLMAWAAMPAVAADQAPKTKYQLAMSHDAHFSTMGEKVNSEYNQILHKILDRDALTDPDKRAQRLVEVKPIIISYAADFQSLGEQFPVEKPDAIRAQQQKLEWLSLWGDQETNKQLHADAEGTNEEKAIVAKAILVKDDWTMASTPEQMLAVADHMEKLDQMYPKSPLLQDTTMGFVGQSSDDHMRERLQDMAIAMDTADSNSLATLKKIRTGAKEIAAVVGKPFVIQGKTSDGKDFSSADWKGKVILVDFWATWCGPCKEELPTIHKLYDENHEKGLEVVGVSNDYKLDDLKKFVAEKKMPWPQLVDAAAMDKHTWNSTTFGYGIDGIPRLFVIDRNGILLDARANKTYSDLIHKALAEK